MKGESEAPGWGGIVFVIENPRRGGGCSRRGRGRGAGRVSAANWGIFGGGGRERLNIFFEAETSTKERKRAEHQK